MRTLPITVTADVHLSGEAMALLHQIDRKLTRVLEGIQVVTTQNEEVAALVEQLGGDVASLRSSLTGVAGDVTDLKAQIAALPAGEPLTAETLENLRGTVADIAEVTDEFATLDESTPAEPAPEPNPNA